ncbi:hypothetical protein ACC728_38515, partial [Rhizobium ruizarguesonis]
VIDLPPEDFPSGTRWQRFASRRSFHSHSFASRHVAGIMQLLHVVSSASWILALCDGCWSTISAEMVR